MQVSMHTIQFESPSIGNLHIYMYKGVTFNKFNTIHLPKKLLVTIESNITICFHVSSYKQDRPHTICLEVTQESNLHFW